MSKCHHVKIFKILYECQGHFSCNSLMVMEYRDIRDLSYNKLTVLDSESLLSLTSLTVLSAQGRLLTNIVPDLPAQHQHPDWRVTEVALHPTLVFIRLHRDSSSSSLILQSDLTRLLTRPGEGSSTTAARVVGESQGEAGSGSRLFVLDTKLVTVNTQPLHIQVFNYFHQ